MTNEKISRSRRNVLLGAAAATLLRNVKIPLEISPEVSGMAAQTSRVAYPKKKATGMIYGYGLSKEIYLIKVFEE